MQLPSVSVAKATMRHYEEDEEPKIGPKKVYLNYSRSRSIESRDGDSLTVNVGLGIGGGGPSNGNNGNGNGLELARVINAARGMDGGNGGGNPMQVCLRTRVLVVVAPTEPQRRRVLYPDEIDNNSLVKPDNLRGAATLHTAVS